MVKTIKVQEELQLHIVDAYKKGKGYINGILMVFVLELKFRVKVICGNRIHNQKHSYLPLR